MTHLVALVAVVLVTVCSTASAAPQNVASLGNGNIDVLLGNQRLVKAEIHCLKGTGSCDQIGKQLKVAVNEVLNNNCRSCTRTQFMNAKKLIKYVMANYPQDYRDIASKYSRRG